MQKPIQFLFLFMTVAMLSLVPLVTGATSADPTITLEQAVHFTTAEGSDVVLDAGDYEVTSAEEWLQITPTGGTPVDALLLEAQVASHEEPLTTPLALSVQGESPDTHHLALLLPDGKRLEAIGTYSGVRARGTLSLLTIQRLRALASRTQSTASTEYSTPLFGGGGR